MRIDMVPTNIGMTLEYLNDYDEAVVLLRKDGTAFVMRTPTDDELCKVRDQGQVLRGKVVFISHHSVDGQVESARMSYAEAADVALEKMAEVGADIECLLRGISPNFNPLDFAPGNYQLLRTMVDAQLRWKSLPADKRIALREDLRSLMEARETEATSGGEASCE